MDYIIFTERNQHEGEEWKFFFPYENNNLYIILSELVVGIDVYSVDVEYGLDTKTLETVEKYSDGGYMRSINVFYTPLDYDELFNLYKSCIDEEKEKEEIRENILKNVKEGSHDEYKDYETKLDEYVNKEYKELLEDAGFSIGYNDRVHELFYKGGIVSFQKKVSN